MGNRTKSNAVKIACRESLLLFLTYAPSILTSLRYATQPGTACTCLTLVAKYKRRSRNTADTKHGTWIVSKYKERILHIAAKWLQLDTCVTVADCDIGPSQVEQYASIIAVFERRRLRHRLEKRRHATGFIICIVLPRLYCSNRKLPVLRWRASGYDSWPPILALVTGRPICRDLNKISGQNLVQYIGSRANVVGEGTRLWVGRYSVWTPTEASNSSLSKTPRPAVWPIEPPVSKMGNGVLTER